MRNAMLFWMRKVSFWTVDKPECRKSFAGEAGNSHEFHHPLPAGKDFFRAIRKSLPKNLSYNMQDHTCRLVAQLGSTWPIRFCPGQSDLTCMTLLPLVSTRQKVTESQSKDRSNTMFCSYLISSLVKGEKVIYNVILRIACTEADFVIGDTVS